MQSSGNSKTLISVIIPTCHRNDLLAKCIECLAPGVQALPSNQYEVIVTDDGSQGTAEQMIKDAYPWARWVAGPRRGPAANRNHGVRYASGDYIAFTDDDCLPRPGWLSAYATMSTLGQGRLVYEGMTTCDEGLRSPLWEAPINLTGGSLWSCNMMLSRALYSEIGGFDENFPSPAMEDADLCLRLKAAGCNIVFVKEAVVDHPPRRSRWGSHYAKLLESHAYLWYKTGNRRSFRRGVVINIFKARLRRITQFPLTLASLSALASWIVEVMYVMRYARAWEKKYGSYSMKNPG